MEKQKITVRVAGRDMTLVSPDAPEYMHRVAAYADRKIQETAMAARLPVPSAAILAAVNLTDELMKAQDENRRLRAEMMQLRAEAEQKRAE